MNERREDSEARLDPVATAAAEEAAGAAGVSLAAWLNRTILENVNRSPTMAPAEGAAGHADGDKIDMRAAEAAAAEAGVELNQWLSRAILTSARRQGTVIEEASGTPAADAGAEIRIDALDKLLANVVTEARAAKEPAAVLPPDASGGSLGPSPVPPTGASRGMPWLTAGMLIIVALSAATIWLLPRLDEFGLRIEGGGVHVRQLPPRDRDTAEKGSAVSATLAAQVAHFRQQAEAGDVGAQLTLGGFYLRGHGVKRDYGKAAGWFRKAGGRGGNAEAQFTLGVMLENGLGGPKDAIEALLWYQRAAQQGHAKALYNAGRLHAQGIGVPRNYARARAYFEGAAKQGIPQAQFNLAALYERGLGVKLDVVEAFRWYSLALAGGETHAGEALDRLMPLLSKKQIRHAKKLIAEFKKS
ncbi:MAG: tetratricopeptide repeat protein [Alphaproteobacteria bacterium]